MESWKATTTRHIKYTVGLIIILDNKYTMGPIFLASLKGAKKQIKSSMSSWIIVLEEQTQVANEPCYLSNISTSADFYVQILHCKHDLNLKRKNETRTMNVNYQTAKLQQVHSNPNYNDDASSMLSPTPNHQMQIPINFRHAIYFKKRRTNNKNHHDMTGMFKIQGRLKTIRKEVIRERGCNPSNT